jgi:hypothetical protein
LCIIPAIYPVRTIIRKKGLFPLFVREFQLLKIETGHAAPKHISIIISKILIKKTPKY